MTRRVDLRSDTITQPTQEMREAMASARVGDDGYGEDPSVNELEARFAEVVGKEAAVFVPSGTMANQIALRILTQPGDVVVAGRAQHMVSFEMGAAARNAGVQFATVDDAVVTPLAALLLNGHLVWTGTGTPTGFPASGVGTNTVIAEDFVNPIRLTRANSLVLQLGYSSNPVVTTGNVVMYSAVGGNFVASEGTLAYTVVDVPGVRSL